MSSILNPQSFIRSNSAYNISFHDGSLNMVYAVGLAVQRSNDVAGAAGC